ncbi:hypothetical protein DY000_02006423 [Brassica cretica]|uniref:Uncharacterized protein n=1 Tax=Brassica cretica TaxID=69181 RepID=A0ABQ7CLY9_BRACR|nr:hypothetical protein DY000_02006423 [Brassica cretica]
MPSHHNKIKPNPRPLEEEKQIGGNGSHLSSSLPPPPSPKDEGDISDSSSHISSPSSLSPTVCVYMELILISS